MLGRAARLAVNTPLILARRIATMILAEERRKREGSAAERDAYRAPEVGADDEVATDVKMRQSPPDGA